MKRPASYVAVHLASKINEVKWSDLPALSDDELGAVTVDVQKSGDPMESLSGVGAGCHILCLLCDPNTSMKLNSFYGHMHTYHEDIAIKDWVSKASSLQLCKHLNSRALFHLAWLKAKGHPDPSTATEPDEQDPHVCLTKC